MKKIDLFIIGYSATLLLDYIFLLILKRLDILVIPGILALIPLVIVLIQRRGV